MSGYRCRTRLVASWRPMQRVVCVAALALLLWTASIDAIVFGHGEPSAAIVEVIYVKGCSVDSTPLRSTSGCFTGGQTKEHITVRGLHFPHEEDGTASNLEIVFEESHLPSIFEDEPGYAAGAVAEFTHKAAQLPCTDVNPSSLFPSQLLTCTLPRPSLETLKADEGDDAVRTAFLARVRQYPVWMDVRVVSEGRTVSILRRALEIDLRGSAKRATATAQYEADGGSKQTSTKSAESSNTATVTGADKTVEQTGPSLEALERLYTPSREDEASSDAPATTRDDVWQTELHVGGLKDELQMLYRRVFLSRLPSLAPITTALGLQHVRGVILYGPPGNGKTLIARGLVRLLGPNTRMSIVNAGDVLSKYVGQSEKNLRDLFEGREVGSTARQEDEDMDHNTHSGPRQDAEKTTGPSAHSLHVLVIDEFDALFHRRGHSEDESSAKAVFDGVTNALLSLMDGVTMRNDILVIGLTNRLDAVDEALLRPGRFEVLIEVPAPDQPAREEIFFIHTEKLRQRDYLGDGVDLPHLAAQTAGFSGSDIAGVVRAATSYAMLRYRHGVARGDAGAAPFQVTAAEFSQAVNEVRDAKKDTGAESTATWTDERVDLIDHDGTLARHTAAVANLTRRIGLANAAKTKLPWLSALSGESDAAFAATVAISGPAGSGKTAVARHLMQQVPDVAGVQFLSGQRLAEMRDVEASLTAVEQAFNSAAKAGGLNAVVIDDADLLAERLRGNDRAVKRLDSMTRRFLRSRAVPSRIQQLRSGAAERHADLHATREETPREADMKRTNARLLVLTVTKQSMLRDMSVDLHIRVHPVTRSGVRRALAHLRIVEDAQSQRAAALSEAYPVSLGFREFQRVTQMALQSGRFAVELSEVPMTQGQTHTQGESTKTKDVAVEEQDEDDKLGSGKAASAASDAAPPSAPILVKDDETAKQYMIAVRDVVSAMGLYDPFQAWYSPVGKKMTKTPEEILEAAKNYESGSDGSELLW